MTTSRFIIVQTSAYSLYGAFTCDAADVATKSVAALDACVVEDMISRAGAGSTIALDKSFYASDVRDELAVYEVPSDFPAYDGTEVSGEDVTTGRLFEGFEQFKLIGAIVTVERDEMAENVTLLGAALHVAEQAGMTVYYDGEDANGTFAIDLEAGDEVEFEGFSGFPTFTVKLADGFTTEVQYDVTQMPAFEDDATLRRAIAADPVTWCRQAAEIAESMRDAA